jgi:hypothetical protein
MPYLLGRAFLFADLLFTLYQDENLVVKNVKLIMDSIAFAKPSYGCLILTQLLTKELQEL